MGSENVGMKVRLGGLRSLRLIRIVDNDRKVVRAFRLARNKVASAKNRLDGLTLPLRLRKSPCNPTKSFNLIVSQRVIDCT